MAAPQKSLLVLLCLAAMTSHAAEMENGQDADTYANTVSKMAPDDFRLLLTLTSKPTEFILPNENTFLTEADLGHAQVTLNTDSDRASILDFLLENGLSRDGADTILGLLDAGMSSDTRCRGDRQFCQVTPDNQLSVVVDAPREKVRLIPAPSLYAKTAGAIGYFNARNENTALINRTNLYTSYVGGDRTTTVNDRVVIGLPWGHIRSELSAYDNNGDRSTSVDSLEYNLDIKGWRLMAGRSRDFNTQNATSLLNFSSQLKEGLYLMSSRNLMRGQSSNYQRAYFYMPQRGMVEVWRGTQMLFSQPADAGQQFLTYDQLPSGVYSLTLKMKTDNNVLTEQQVSIVNNPSVTLPIGKADWSFGMADMRNDTTRLTVAEINMAVRPSGALVLAAGINAAQDEQMYSLGGSWTVTDDVQMDMAFGRFSDQSFYWQNTVSWQSIYLTWQSFRPGNTGASASVISPEQSPRTGRKAPLSEVMLGRDDYDVVTLTLNYPIMEATGYTSLNYNYRATSETEGAFRGFNLTSGLTTPFIMGSTVGLSVSAGRNQMLANNPSGNDRDDYSVSLNWSVPLDEKRQVMNNLQYSKNDTMLTSTVRQQFTHSDSLTSSLEAGGRWRSGDGLPEATITGSVNHNGEQFTASGSGTLNTKEGNVLFASLGGSQVISRQGVFLTASDSESFLLVRNRTEIPTTQTDADAPQVAGQLTLKNSSSKFSSAQSYRPESGATLTPLERYRGWNVKLHTANTEFYNAGDKEIRGFSFPGTVVAIEPQLEKEYQLIGAFYLPSGTPADNLRCEGKSCLQVDKLDEGLFKVRLSGRDGFRLLSGNTLCLNEQLPDTSTRLTRLPGVRCQAIPKNESQLELTARPDHEGKLTRISRPETPLLQPER
ncbi:MAG TPA: hypothetical protein DIT05_03990 [Morganella sp. (in: Bacteria)]|nr:hypothetical protein [Morganella sp. (in: enterobacteria)]